MCRRDLVDYILLVESKHLAIYAAHYQCAVNKVQVLVKSLFAILRLITCFCRLALLLNEITLRNCTILFK